MDRRKRHKKAKAQRAARRAREARDEFRASIASNAWATRDAVRMLANARQAWRDVRAETPPPSALERIQALMLLSARESRNEAIFGDNSALALSWDDSTPRIWRLLGTNLAVARSERRMVEMREYREDGPHECEHTGARFALLSLPADISPGAAKRALVFLVRANRAEHSIGEVLPDGIDAGHVPETCNLPSNLEGSPDPAPLAHNHANGAEWTALQQRHDTRNKRR